MNRALIITVAGESTRFRETLGLDVLKCIYSPNGYSKTILNFQLSVADDFDKIIIVGGYKFDELKEFISSNYSDDRIVTIYNSKYNSYGSGYSLQLGVDYLENFEFDEIVFCEGDLYFDKESFQLLMEDEKDVVTANSDMINAKKSVAFYSTINNSIKYVYDTKHVELEIKEPFVGIYNSGQIWKFINQNKLNSVVSELNQSQIEGTNLVVIENYFSVDPKYTIIRLNEWINCNTVHDYKLIEKLL